MVIYLLLLIPIVTAIVLFLFFERRMLWWEFCIPFASSVVLVVLLKLGVDHMSMTSTEYWGSFVERAEYYEEWDEWVDQTCTEECCCDSKGQNCQTRTYDCSYRDYHPPYLVLTNTIGEKVSISQSEYKRIRSILGNEGKTDLHRDYYRIDGDMYSTIWGKDSLTAIPVTTVHSYENRIKASDATVFNFRDLDETDIKRYALKEYPPIQDRYKMDVVLGDSSRDASIANKKLKYVNGKLGHSKELCAFILVFKDQPLEAAFKQEAHWKGANMNEFVVCIGIDAERNVQWCKVISWTTNERLKMDVRSMVDQQKKLDLSGFVDQLSVALTDFKRRDFKEFDYLTVEPSWAAIIFCAIAVILLNILVSWWAINNEHEEGGGHYRYR